ncbi:hypothetical protein [Coleofasciculus sp. FACHB-SPT36]|nr:hypothetical protein [Coleofasciculus sp. FACHB-SPT36]
MASSNVKLTFALAPVKSLELKVIEAAWAGENAEDAIATPAATKE